MNNVNIDVSANNNSECALKVDGSASLNLTLNGDNTLKSGGDSAGLQVGDRATLVITEQSTGNLTVTGGSMGAGIGGAYTADAGNITIKGGTIEIGEGNTKFVVNPDGSVEIRSGGTNYLDAMKEMINPDSLKVLTECYVEKYLANAKPLDYLQFQRIGYFNVDKDSTPDKLIFNRTVSLKDTWSKINK